MSSASEARDRKERTGVKDLRQEELLRSVALAGETSAEFKGLCKKCANREICRKRKSGEIIMSCASHDPGPPIRARVFKSFDEILDFALEKEEKTATFYLKMAENTGKPSTRKAFKTLAKRSLKHRKRLLKVKRNGNMTIAPKNIQGLKITTYVTKGVPPHAEMDTREALVLAIRTASVTQNLYSDLANQAADPKIQALFGALAQEEAELKLKLETEYDDYVFAQD